MPASTTFDEPPEFKHRHHYRTHPAPIPLRRLPHGSRGNLIARTAGRLFAVRIDDGRVEHVHPSALALDPDHPSG